MNPVKLGHILDHFGQFPGHETQRIALHRFSRRLVLRQGIAKGRFWAAQAELFAVPLHVSQALSQVNQLRDHFGSGDRFVRM